MVLKRLEEAYRDENTGISLKPANLIALSELIHNTENKGRMMVKELLNIPTLNKDEEKQNQDTVNWFLNEYFADKSKVYENTSGVRTQVANLIQNKYLRKVLNPEGKSDINFERAIENGEVIAITTALGELGGLSKYLGYFLILSYQSAIFKRKGDEDTRIAQYLYIDEFQIYSNPSFSNLLTMGRSYRVGCFIATQSREQIAMGSGSDGKGFLSVVSANARNVITFSGLSKEDAKYYSDDYGAEIQEQVRRGTSKQVFKLGYGAKNMNYPTESEQYSESLENIFSATDITYKEFKEITYKIVENGTVKMGRNGVANWIDAELNENLKAIYRKFREEQLALRQKVEEEEMVRRREKNKEFLMSKNIHTSTNNSSPQKDSQIDVGKMDAKAGWG